jgi:hypothetical protein
MTLMAKYLSNEAAVAKARKLIDARQYVLDSDRGEVRSYADAQNAYLESHSWDEYGGWHPRLTEVPRTTRRHGMPLCTETFDAFTALA